MLHENQGNLKQKDKIITTGIPNGVKCITWAMCFYT